MSSDRLREQQSTAAHKKQYRDELTRTACALLERFRMEGVPEVKRLVTESLRETGLRYEWGTAHLGVHRLTITDVGGIDLLCVKRCFVFEEKGRWLVTFHTRDGKLAADEPGRDREYRTTPDKLAAPVILTPRNPGALGLPEFREYRGEWTGPSDSPKIADALLQMLRGTMPKSAPYDRAASSCLIATTLLGADSREVRLLREFRDSVLVENSPGRLLVAAYDMVSPCIVRVVAHLPTAQALLARVVRLVASWVARD